jgi:hypothetical protein
MTPLPHLNGHPATRRAALRPGRRADPARSALRSLAARGQAPLVHDHRPATRGTTGTDAVPLLGADRTIALDGHVVWAHGRPVAGVHAHRTGGAVMFTQTTGTATGRCQICLAMWCLGQPSASRLVLPSETRRWM